MSDDHLSLDELAELDEGLLSPERERAARAHLAGCSQCEDQAAAIQAVRAKLGELPPVSMPDDVAARLARVLADEPALAPTSPTSGAADHVPSPEWDGGPTIIPDLSEVRTRRLRFGRPTMAASAVAAALVLGGAAIVIGHLNSNSSHLDSSAGTATAPEPAASNEAVGPNPTGGSFATSASGRTYSAATLDTLIPTLVKSAQRSGEAPVQSGASSTATQVPSPASGIGSTDGGPSTATGTVPAGSRPTFAQDLKTAPKPLRAIAASKSRLLQCAAAVTGTPGSVPEAIDFGRWTGGTLHSAPSIFLVFNGPRPSTVAVYVVGPTCDPNALRTYTVVPLTP